MSGVPSVISLQRYLGSDSTQIVQYEVWTKQNVVTWSVSYCTRMLWFSASLWDREPIWICFYETWWHRVWGQWVGPWSDNDVDPHLQFLLSALWSSWSHAEIRPWFLFFCFRDQETRSTTNWGDVWFLLLLFAVVYCAPLSCVGNLWQWKDHAANRTLKRNKRIIYRREKTSTCG